MTKTAKTVTVNGKEWNKEAIKELLEKSDKAVERAITVIYGYQTEDEKRIEGTSHDNGMGFNKIHAEFLSSLAQQIEKGRTLSPKQIAIGRKMIVHYSGQLLKHMIKMQAV